MSDIVFLQAAVVFKSELDLDELAGLIASVCFCSARFVGRDEHLWDEVPAVRLDRDVLGMEVVLGGHPGVPGGYTLEVASRDPLGGDLPAEPGASRAAICEFSGYLRGLLATIPQISVST